MVNPPSCLVTIHAPYSFYSARINLKLLLSNIINQKNSLWCLYLRFCGKQKIVILFILAYYGLDKDKNL